MKTSKIVIKNLFGIRETTLDGKSVEISGPKGAGKTSVLDAIRFALTNRSERDCIVHQGADEGEIIIETTTGLSIDRKALPAKSAGTVKVRDGSLLQTRPAEFLSQIFTPLQLNPVEFTQLSRQEKNRVILSLIEFDWDVNWIREQFGEIPQGVDYSKHILEVLNDIQAENGVYFQSRQNINRDIRNKQAFISDIAKDIPSGYDYDRWNQYPIGDRYLLPGNGYTYVDWVSNRIDGLYYVDPMQVSAEIGADPIFKTARFFIGGRSYRDYEIMRILRNTRDGVTGSGLVAESPIQLETMLNALKYENRMVKTGAKKGFLKVEKDKKVSQTVLDQLRNSWRKMYGPDSEETTVILNDGVDFKDAGQTAVETQLNENKQTNAHEIYRIFNIAPTILEGDATAEDLKNTVRFAIAPVVKALQLAINRFCLLEAEKGVLAFEIDMDALDGTDMLARYQAYEVAIRNGWMQLDEVRYDEGRNPLGLKFIRLGLDTVIYDPESRMIYTPNTKEWASIDQKGGGEPIAGRDPSG